MPVNADEVPLETRGLRLCKIEHSALKLSEPVFFVKGRRAIITTLIRANLAGHVGGDINPDTDFWVDMLDGSGDLLGEIRLERKSWNSLKNRWMPCRMCPPDAIRARSEGGDSDA